MLPFDVTATCDRPQPLVAGRTGCHRSDRVLPQSSEFRIDANHWLVNVHRCPTSNRAERSGAREVELVVIHGISLPPGQFGGGYVAQLFTNTLVTSAHPSFSSLAGVRVSAHVFLDREGHLLQFVPFSEIAWHAGVSSWRGRTGCNRFSIGIELEGTDDLAYTDAQYFALAGVLRALFVTYPKLGRDAIVGHSEIAPGRKTDPGPAFDWQRLFRMLDR